MDPAPPIAGFQALGQYGVAGAIAAGMLTLFVVIFKRLVDNVIKQNEHLQERQQEIQQQQISGMAALQKSIDSLGAILSTDVRELSREIAEVFNAIHHERREITGPIRLGARRPTTPGR